MSFRKCVEMKHNLTWKLDAKHFFLIVRSVTLIIINQDFKAYSPMQQQEYSSAPSDYDESPNTIHTIQQVAPQPPSEFKVHFKAFWRLRWLFTFPSDYYCSEFMLWIISRKDDMPVVLRGYHHKSCSRASTQNSFVRTFVVFFRLNVRLLLSPVLHWLLSKNKALVSKLRFALGNIRINSWTCNEIFTAENFLILRFFLFQNWLLTSRLNS